MNNSSNELTSTSIATYTYDYDGNLLTKAVGSNTTSYTWDFENRLTSVTLPGSGGPERRAVLFLACCDILDARWDKVRTP